MQQSHVGGAPSGENNEHMTASEVRRRKREDSSSSSFSETRSEKRSRSRPPNKRARSDPRVDDLINKVGYITNYLSYIQGSQNIIPSMCAGESETNDSFLINPATSKPLDLGEVETKIDNKKVIKQSSKERVDAVVKLQRFSSDAWKEVKYSKTLQNFLATPGITELKINDELCHLNRCKDFLAQTERVMAGLTNALLDQKDCLRSSLQEIINWANNSPT